MRPYLFVTVESDMFKGTYDIEVPTYVRSGQLQKDISEVLTAYTGSYVGCRKLYCNRLQKYLDAELTFEQLGVWNGDVIKLMN